MTHLQHQDIGLNTLMVIEIIGQGGNKPENMNLEKILDVLGKGQKNNRKYFRDYLAAPDLIRDLYIEVLLGLANRYEFFNHNLSAFQHFIIPEDSDDKYRGYRWDCDDSLGSSLEEAGNVIMGIASVKYDTNVDAYGFDQRTMADSPMNKLVSKVGDVDLDDFEFPTASTVGGYYGTVAENTNDQITKAGAAGFSLHFVMDACCPHHIAGYLLSEHTKWEEALESNWLKRFDQPKNQAQLDKKFTIIAGEVSDYLGKNPDLAKLNSVEKVIESNANYIHNEWLTWDNNREMSMKGTINGYHTKEICTRAIASCMISLNLMFQDVIP